ncbi:substrate-binding domain-containing protein [Pectinatus haikarae]|uniref:Phosphonate transport system substrate-binding protein n=1 Tax=Pectinatus haikarae TaxID=349096 RepID=A0ABT9YA83_9FIRM|nr:phosphate/phosphite/phosphonate ABC transporter substrate-binding protein [Pectinatus haikarae]MDQ0204754.1 phosphonate transport system substrate-binding protein [Pectinatus haikarae]
MFILHHLKDKYYIAVLLILVLFFIAFNYSNPNTYDSYIDFSKGSPLIHQKYSTSDDDNEERPLRIVISTVISPNVTIEDWRAFADYISQKLGRPTILLQRRGYKEINQLLSNGDADISFMSTGAYCSYHGIQNLDILAMVFYQGSLNYQSYLITLASHNDITSIDDLRGRTIAFSDPLSYSGHMSIVNELYTAYTASPGHYFSNYIYTGSHDRSIWAVKNKLIDAACVDSLVYDLILKSHPEDINGIKIFQTIDNIPIGPIVVRSDLPAEQKEHLQQILFNMHSDPKMADSLQNIMIDKFVAPQPELYAPYKKIYDKVMTDL